MEKPLVLDKMLTLSTLPFDQRSGQALNWTVLIHLCSG